MIGTDFIKELTQYVSDTDAEIAELKTENARLREALENVHNISCDNVDDRQSVHDVYAVSLKALKERL